MTTYVAFLRGINVSGKHKVLMSELRKLCENLNLQQVMTYIQSGNIVFNSTVGSTVELEELLSKAILNDFGFNVPVIVKTVSGLQEILNHNPFITDVEILSKQIYFVLFKNNPNIDALENFKSESFDNEEFVIVDTCIYLKCKSGYGKAKLNNNLIERKLKVLATTRNYRTMIKLIELS
ncbi:hypothetical protein LCGC14_0081730 [marine sediment metagenome]|uniref:DUF1697 domain-containing protein n=2 Tax=root TaxID=1 RepID=A0A0F9VID6_9ZZZZ